jgi:lipopolysaccharide export LptBFGC system permease protein LptF
MKEYELGMAITLLLMMIISICLIGINPIISGYIIIVMIFIALIFYISNMYYKRYQLRKKLLNIKPIPVAIQVPHIVIIEGYRYYIGVPV